jgi:hypothetical protein
MFRFVLFFLIVGPFFCCVNPVASRLEVQATSDSFRTDLQGLNRFVNLSSLGVDTTKEVRWQFYSGSRESISSPGPSDHYFIAYCSIKDFNDSIFVIKNVGPCGDVEDNKRFPDWVPKDALAVYERGINGDSDTCKVILYDGSPFLRYYTPNCFLLHLPDNKIYFFYQTI